MHAWVAAITTLGVAVVGASVAYQFVKPGSQGVAALSTVGGTAQGITNTLYKG